MTEIGALYKENGVCEFSVWAPLHQAITLHLEYPREEDIALKQEAGGYWSCAVKDIPAGARYTYRLPNGTLRPDPASHSQPEGVHRASEVIDHRAFAWGDRQWQGIPVKDMIIYELHVGAFSPEAHFRGVSDRLDELLRLGINAIEIMPVAQFPGERNWGYDGVYPFAVHNSYGGPHAFKQLIDTCHQKGMAVILDVVYNHLGPEGNYVGCFAPYFTAKYMTPWGDAVNFDDEHNEGVRNYVLQNALHWLERYHLDALRLDAVHGIFDESSKHILAELSEQVRSYAAASGRKVYLIAESDLNKSAVVRPIHEGGWGIDAQWCDDFHHALHTVLTQESRGYYADFGSVSDLEKSFRDGFVYSGEFSRFRQRHHGDYAGDLEGHRFIVFSQNHDQVGNRAFGERLITLAGFEAAKLAALTVMSAPSIPLLFMGEEYGEESPFLYFVSHSDPALIQAVREGRKKEFSSFEWGKEPPDPQETETFRLCALGWNKRSEGSHKVMLDFYSSLIILRKEIPALSCCDKKNMNVSAQGFLLCVRRSCEQCEVMIILNFSRHNESYSFPGGSRIWRKNFDSADKEWDGPGSLLEDTLLQPAELGMQPLQGALYISKETA